MSSGQGQAGRVARAATRYRPGKAPMNAQDDYSSEESDGGQEQRRREARKKEGQEGDEPITDVSRGTAALKNAHRRTAGVIIQGGGGGGSGSGRKPVVKLDDVKIGKQREPMGGKVEEADDSDEYETDTDAEDERQAPRPVFRKPGAGAAATLQKEESSEYETDSEGEESSEEEQRPAMLKPMFIPKRQRETMRAADEDVEMAAAEDGKKGEEEGGGPETGLAEERRKQSHLLAAETIKRELAERDHEEAQPDVSDTDGRDPEEEFQAWRIRELSRLKQDRERAVEKEAERAEVERRRSMPEAQRLKEDMERAKKSREEKKRDRQPGDFLQKYHHKGSFFQDMDIMKKDYSGKTENAVDMSLLPSVMQVRDYGKAGRSKWTHLAQEDTSRQQQDHRLKGISGVGAGERQGGGGTSSGQQCFACGGPHLRRDCPGTNDGQQAGRGANSVPLQERPRGGDSRGQRRSRTPDRRRPQHSSNSWRER